MTIRRAHQRAAEDLQQELIHILGWHAATALIHREAENLRVDPESSAAIRHAYAVHQSTQSKKPEQGELL